MAFTTHDYRRNSMLDREVHAGYNGLFSSDTEASSKSALQTIGAVVCRHRLDQGKGAVFEKLQTVLKHIQFGIPRTADSGTV